MPGGCGGVGVSKFDATVRVAIGQTKGSIFAIIEQFTYTLLSLLVFIVLVSRYETSVAANTLSLIAILNIVVPFHAILIGWNKHVNEDIWLGSKSLQVILIIIVALSSILYVYGSDQQLGRYSVLPFLLAAVVAVWVSGTRWILIKKAKFALSGALNIASTAIFLGSVYYFSFDNAVGVFFAFVASKSTYLLALLYLRLVGNLEVSSSGQPQRLQTVTLLLAFFRFLRSNGVFVIVSLISSEAAIFGRAIQMGIGISRVFQNPIANFVYFHWRAGLNLSLITQTAFGTLVAISIYAYAVTTGITSIPLLSAISVLSGTAGFIGIFLMRVNNTRFIAVVFEALSAIIFLLAVIILPTPTGYAIGIIISQSVLFLAGVLVISNRSSLK